MRNEYIERINRVIDYIESHLDKEITLDELAAVANFSKFHFHRIFFSMVGETLFQFIQRTRIEKAAAILLNQPQKSITDIAFECGFVNNASFSRSFKEKMGCAPSEWRKKSDFLKNSNFSKFQSNLRKTDSSESKVFPRSFPYTVEYKNNSTIWRIEMEKTARTVEVREFAPMNVAYIRHIGPYKGNSQLFENLFERLCKWAYPRNLVNHAETRFLIVYHDNPDITAEEKLRTSVCLTVAVAEDTPVEGEIGKMSIAGGKYAVCRFELKTNEFEEAWNWLYGSWLPDSGYITDDRMCFEMYPIQNEAQKNHFTVDICNPVKPL